MGATSIIASLREQVRHKTSSRLHLWLLTVPLPCLQAKTIVAYNSLIAKLVPSGGNMTNRLNQFELLML